ncbi:MAG: hypothetical protein QW331_00710 [Candidatus Woesearchaeota archaeon]
MRKMISDEFSDLFWGTDTTQSTTTARAKSSMIHPPVIPDKGYLFVVGKEGRAETFYFYTQPMKSPVLHEMPLERFFLKYCPEEQQKVFQFKCNKKLSYNETVGVYTIIEDGEKIAEWKGNTKKILLTREDCDSINNSLLRKDRETLEIILNHHGLRVQKVVGGRYLQNDPYVIRRRGLQEFCGL